MNPHFEALRKAILEEEAEATKEAVQAALDAGFPPAVS